MQLEAESSCSHGPSPASTADRKCWTASLLHDKASVLRSPGRHSPVQMHFRLLFRKLILADMPRFLRKQHIWSHFLGLSMSFWREAMPVFAPDADRPIESSQPESGDSPKRLEKFGKNLENCHGEDCEDCHQNHQIMGIMVKPWILGQALQEAPTAQGDTSEMSNVWRTISIDCRLVDVASLQV